MNPMHCIHVVKLVTLNFSSRFDFFLRECSVVKKNKGPWAHRLLIGILTVAMAILSIWLLGFIVDDIGSLPGPNYDSLEKRLLDP